MIKPEEGQVKRSPNWRDHLQAVTDYREEHQTGRTPFPAGAKTLGYKQMESGERVAMKQIEAQKAMKQAEIASRERIARMQDTTTQRMHAETTAFNRWRIEQDHAMAREERDLYAELRAVEVEYKRAQTDAIRHNIEQTTAPSWATDMDLFGQATSGLTPTQQAWQYLF